MNNGERTIAILQAVVIVIAAIINAAAILFAPALKEVVKTLLAQPTPNPDENQPKERSNLRRFWGSYLVILFNVGYLIVLLLNTTPITRLDVLSIALAVVGIFFQFALITTVVLSGRNLDAINRHGAMMDRNLGILESVVDAIFWLEHQIKSLGHKPTEKPPEALSGLRSAIKKLIGG